MKVSILQMKADIQAFQMSYLSHFDYEYLLRYAWFSNGNIKRIFLQATVHIILSSKEVKWIFPGFLGSDS